MSTEMGMRAPSNAEAVIELLVGDRPIELISRFEHGASGTSLARLAGQPVVVKAWREDDGREQVITEGLRNAEIMASRSVPIPRLLERGTVTDYGYLIYEFVEGQWPAKVDSRLANQMLALVKLQRDAAPQGGPHWPATVADLVSDGDVALDIHPNRLRNHPLGQQLLRDAEHALDQCDLDSLRTTDIVHADFAPENVLVNDGQITAVLDWEQSRVGDASFDLAGMVFDIEVGEKADASVLADLYANIRSTVPADAWALYTTVYAIRYASWALNTDMEDEVISTISRVASAR